MSLSINIYLIFVCIERLKKNYVRHNFEYTSSERFHPYNIMW